MKWTDPIQLAEEGSAHPLASRCLTAVTRRPDTIELFWIDVQGAIKGLFWYQDNDRETGKWGPSNPDRTRSPYLPYTLTAEDSAVPGLGLSAVSRKSNTIELFWIDQKNAIRGRFWYEGMVVWGPVENNNPSVSAQPYYLTPPSTATRGVTAVSRNPKTLQVFWIDPQGAIRSRYWYKGMDEWRPYEPNEPLKLAEGARQGGDHEGDLVAIARKLRFGEVNGTMDVFFKEVDGDVCGFTFSDNSWGNVDKIDKNRIFDYRPAKGFAAISLEPKSCKLFWSSIIEGQKDECTIWEGSWTKGSEWQIKEMGNSYTHKNAEMTAGKTINSYWVAWIDGDGSIKGRFKNLQNEMEAFDVAPAGSIDINGSLTAVSRMMSSKIEIFWIAKDGSVWFRRGEINSKDN